MPSPRQPCAPPLSLSSGVVPLCCLLGCAFPPLLAACVRRLRLFWEGPLRLFVVGRAPCRACAPWGVAPPCRLLRCIGHWRRSRSHLGSLRRGLSRGGGLCCRVPGVVACPISSADAVPADKASRRCGHSRAGTVFCRLPCTPVSVLAVSSIVLLAVTPRGAASSLPLGACPWVGQVGGGFSSPPPRPRPSFPRRDRDAVGAPMVSSPAGPPPSLGVKLSHDNSTPPPLCWFDSSCHDLTPPPPLHWGLNLLVTT